MEPAKVTIDAPTLGEPGEQGGRGFGRGVVALAPCCFGG